MNEIEDFVKTCQKMRADDYETEPEKIEDYE